METEDECLLIGKPWRMEGYCDMFLAEFPRADHCDDEARTQASQALLFRRPAENSDPPASLLIKDTLRPHHEDLPRHAASRKRMLDRRERVDRSS